MAGQRILVVDDEQDVRDVLEYVLREHGFEVITAADGKDARRQFDETAPHLVILDLTLPDTTGMELFRLFRAERESLPVIMLTSRCDEVDRIVGLELGADDYVTKPFSPRELVARVRSVLRRSENGTGMASSAAAPRVGELAMDPDRFCACFSGHTVELHRSEFRLLESMVRHPARLFSRDVLIERVYQGEAYVSDRAVDSLIKRVRRRFLEEGTNVDPIKTVYGLGYKLNPELDIAPTAQRTGAL